MLTSPVYYACVETSLTQSKFWPESLFFVKQAAKEMLNLQKIARAIGPAMLAKIVDISLLVLHSGLEVIKLENSFRLK